MSFLSLFKPLWTVKISVFLHSDKPAQGKRSLWRVIALQKIKGRIILGYVAISNYHHIRLIPRSVEQVFEQISYLRKCGWKHTVHAVFQQVEINLFKGFEYLMYLPSIIRYTSNKSETYSQVKPIRKWKQPLVIHFHDVC